MRETAPAEDVERERAWEDLIACLRDAGVLDGHGPLVDEMARRVFVLPSYANIDEQELRQSLIDCMGASLRGVMERRLPSPDDDDSLLREVGESRARAGVSVAEMLQTGVAFQTVLCELATELAPESPYRDSLLLELFGLVQSWSSWAMLASAAGHRDAELEMQSRAQAQQDEFVRRVLTGALAASELGLGVEAYGLDRSQRYRAFRARVPPGTDVRELERYLRIAPSAGRRAGMMAMIDGDLCGFLTTLPESPAPVAIGVSPAVPLHELAAVFRLATRALETALAAGHRRIVSLEDLGLEAAVVADHDVGELLHARYVAPLLDQGLSGGVILATVERYLSNSARLEQTAKELFVHPNTIRYRLSRFEAVTGCSLREYDAVVAVWWALRWHRVRYGGAGLEALPASAAA